MACHSFQGKERTCLVKPASLFSLMIPTVAILSFLVTSACSFTRDNAESSGLTIEPAAVYSWTNVTESAPFPGSYNYPVFVAQNRMWVFHQQGIWHSADGKTWTKSDLPSVRRDFYEAQYVQFKQAVYALGQNQGNYLNIRFGSSIRRTTDFHKWETLAEKSNLPNRIFNGLVVFNDKLWILGGYDGKTYYHDVWNSSDGVNWTRVVEHAPWTPRTMAAVVAFKNRIWIIGGGVIDGTPTNNDKAGNEVWSSADGAAWTQVTDRMPKYSGGSPVVFDGKLWLVGSNRDGVFARSSVVTNDGVNWTEESAPWSPRSGVATWIFNDKLYMTGGKYSVTENGQIRFIYNNDVWYMAPAAK